MIGNDAFNGSTVTNVIIGNGVTSIGDRAFLGCTNLLTLTIGNSVTNIGNEAFRVCFVLRSVTIPRSVTHIGDEAFFYASLVIQRQIYFMGDAPSLGLDVFAYNPDSTAYYLPARTGWSATYGGIPTSLWHPLVLTDHPSFGVGKNAFGFTSAWASGMTTVVEAKTDLSTASWVPLATNTFIDGLSYFSDPQYTNNPSRVYRLRWPN